MIPVLDANETLTAMMVAGSPWMDRGEHRKAVSRLRRVAEMKARDRKPSIAKLASMGLEVVNHG